MPQPKKTSGTPDSSRTLDGLLRSQAGQRGSAVALRCNGRQTTYAELHRASNRVAAALRKAGVGPGDRVAVWAKDSEASFEVIFGCAKVGAVVLCLNWRLVAAEIGFILEDSGAVLCFASQEYVKPCLDLCPSLPALRQVFEFDGFSKASLALCAESYSRWRDSEAGDDFMRPADPEEVVAQLYTSGTTGKPKGVMLAHRSFFAVVHALHGAKDPWIGFHSGDVSLLAIGVFHIGGMWWSMTTFLYGARLVIMDAFVGHRALWLIEAERVTKVFFVPAMIQVCLGEPNAKSADLGSLDCVVYGGSPIPSSLLERAEARFACGFAQIYGLTETGNTAVCLRPEDHLEPNSPRRLAAGRPYPGFQVKIVAPDGSSLPVKEVGEIAIRSPANMVGYYKREQASLETLREGWIFTGDAGYLDQDGYVYVHDRIKDMISYAGENVYPAEVESVLCAHPAVLEAAVIGVPDEKWGERVKAILVLRPGHSLAPAEILQFCRGKLADFKLPSSIDLMESLPRTPSGKLKKAELRRPYWQGRERQVN